MSSSTGKYAVTTVEQAHDKFVVVDASNVAFDPSGSASLQRILLVREALLRAGFTEFAFIADASLRHRLSAEEAALFEEMIKSKQVFQAPANSSADEFIIDLARRKDGLVLSNDLFRSHLDRWKLLPARRVPYLIVDEEVLFSGIEVEEALASEAAAAEAVTEHVTAGLETTGGAARRGALFGTKSPLFDLGLRIPIVSGLGGFAAATVWILCLGAIFAPINTIEASPLAFVLTGVLAAILLPVATVITGLIAAAYFTGDHVRASEAEIRSWTVMSMILWITGGITLYVALAQQVSGLASLGLILAVGPAFPLIGFIRSAKKFQPFITWIDHALVLTVCLLAAGWIMGESYGIYYIAQSSLTADDKALVIFVLALLMIQASLVLGRWAISPTARAETAG